MVRLKMTIADCQSVALLLAKRSEGEIQAWLQVSHPPSTSSTCALRVHLLPALPPGAVV